MKNALLLTSIILLTGCGHFLPTQTEEATPAKPTPAPKAPAPKELFIPPVGAPVGTTNGTPEGTVYVSPTAEEIQILNYVNEIRTKGTLNGENLLTQDNCLSKTNFVPKKEKALSYNGFAAYAARKHAVYIAKSPGEYQHVEHNAASPYFYGTEPIDRVKRAYQELGGAFDIYKVSASENIHKSYYPGTLKQMKSQVDSYWHCINIIRPENKELGVGYQAGFDENHKEAFFFAINFIVHWK